MSYYYNYYLGYMNGDGVVNPLGPFDENGKFHDVLWLSRSFASDLHELFTVLPEDKMSGRLKDIFTFEDWYGEQRVARVKILPLSQLPKGDYIKKGYFLLEDIERYEKYIEENGGRYPYDTFDVLFDTLSEGAFARKLQNEITYGKPEKQYDCEGEELDYHPCSDYAFYMYPNYMSREYEAEVIRINAAPYETVIYDMGDDEVKIVVLETEG